MTGTALDLNHAAAALAIQPGQISWDPMQLAALTQLGIKDASDGDKSVFLHQCQRTGLDPFARQIYMIGRNEKKSEKRNGQWVDTWSVKWTIQTGIEGWRVIRDRAERRAGVRGILSRFVYYDPDGNEHKVWVQPRPPVACEVTYTVVEASGREVPYTSVLRFNEYVQMKDDKAIAQWAVKPTHMLEKCTEADVYRRAFPQDFSGIYLDDTMPQDTLPDDDGRPRGRVTPGEIIGRDEAPAAQDDTRSQPRVEPDGRAQQGSTGERTARKARPRAAGAAPSRGAQPPAPQDPPPDEDGQHHLTETDIENEPGSASEDQLTSLHIILGGLGFGSEDREQKLRIAETITGHAPLTGPVRGRSTKNLSFTGARKLIDALDGFGGDREKLIAFMAEREQDGGGDD